MPRKKRRKKCWIFLAEKKMAMPEKRCGFICVAGPSNSGKSTLMNALVGTKVSIVSPRTQTTRSRTLGILNRNSSQIILVDTPGIFDPKRRLERAMVSAAWSSAGGADITAIVIDATKSLKKKPLEEILQKFKEREIRSVLVINKIDLVDKKELLETARSLNENYTFEATFMVSALQKQGLDRLLDYFSKAVPEGPWHYDEDEITDVPERVLAAEITREKIFWQLRQELPYSVHVRTENWENFSNGQILIEQVVYVSRKNHKAIMLGRNGSRIKKIGEASRQDLCRIFETEVHLKLHVKIKENWDEDACEYELLGLDYDN
jgi:GTP-binding protein Era